MEREIRTWWNDLNRADQDAWMAAWEADAVTPDLALTLPADRFDRWTAGDAPRRINPALADFLEQQAAGRFLDVTRTQAPPA